MAARLARLGAVLLLVMGQPSRALQERAEEESVINLGAELMVGDTLSWNATSCLGKPYQLPNGACVASCPGGTAPAVAYNNTCTACKDSTPYVYNNSCVSVCPAQHVITGGDNRNKYNCRPCEAELPFVDRARHACVEECPEYSDDSDCVSECPAGAAPQGCLDGSSSCPDEKNATRCRQCSNPNPEDGFDPVPYADHAEHKCVAQCPSGHAPNPEKSCVECEGETKYTTPHQCVSECPSGQGRTVFACNPM